MGTASGTGQGGQCFSKAQPGEVVVAGPRWKPSLPESFLQALYPSAPESVPWGLCPQKSWSEGDKEHQGEGTQLRAEVWPDQPHSLSASPGAPLWGRVFLAAGSGTGCGGAEVRRLEARAWGPLAGQGRAGLWLPGDPS